MAVIVSSGNLDLLAARLSRLSRDIDQIRATGMPPAELLKDVPVFDCWALGFIPAPCLTGSLIGHPILGRSRIRSTEIVAFDQTNGWARTWSGFYRLGRRNSRLIDGSPDE